ncbi:MAG: hypothetical protein CSA75_05145 [Sorangium cellulosum]|nr:MAG: hypothetical protein CSA75_05145 [Sorangium cellulosum]
MAPTQWLALDPAHRAVLGKVQEDGKTAAIGFDNDAYFLHTAKRRFVLEGTLRLREELALTFPGPLIIFEANLDQGRVVEGNLLTGLLDTTIHFNALWTLAPLELAWLLLWGRGWYRPSRATQKHVPLVS